MMHGSTNIKEEEEEAVLEQCAPHGG